MLSKSPRASHKKRSDSLRNISISDLFLCVILLRSLCLEDLLRPSPLQRLQTDPVHLIQEHRQEACLHAVSRLTA